MKIILASNNKNKLREFSEILNPLGYEVVSQGEMGFNEEVEETGSTFAENAELKAKAVYKKYGLPVISDDSGLEVDYLNKAPGIYSARYCGENASDYDRCMKILEELKGVENARRTARFVCVICYVDKDGNTKTISGTCEGYIGTEMRGENGFGYDPIFMVGGKSFAEIPPETKNSISHRANAVRRFIKIFKGEK